MRNIHGETRGSTATVEGMLDVVGRAPLLRDSILRPEKSDDVREGIPT